MNLINLLPPIGWLLIAVLFGSSRRIFIRFLVKQEKDYVSLIAFDKSLSVIYLIIIILIVSMTNSTKINLDFHQVPLIGWISMLSSAILFTTAAFFVFRANRTIQVGEREVFGQMKNIWVLILSVLFLSEIFTLQKLFAIILISGGAILTTYRGTFKRLGVEGIKLILIAELIIALGSLFDKISINYFSPFILPFAFLTLTSLTSFAIMGKNSYARLTSLWAKYNFKLLFFATLSLFSFIAFYIALLNTPLSEAVPIKSSQVVLTAVLGAIFLGEKEGFLNKLVGAILAISGILLLV